VGSVTVDFAAQDSTFDFLSAGQVLTAVYDVAVSDGNGGVAHQAATFTITGTDDAPVLNGQTDLLVNGDFSAGSQGWSNTNPAGVEVNPAGSAYGNAGGSNLVMEVDNDHTFDDVSQTVATTPGQTYVFSFDTALRANASDPASNSYAVLWNGQVIDTVTPASTAWEHHTYAVTAAGFTGEVEFREIVNDGYGGIIDNVSLKAGFVERAGVTGSTALDTATTTTSFTDVDLADHHTATVAGLPSVVWSGGAAPAGLADLLAGDLTASVTDTGTGAGSVTATLSAADATFDFLKAGQTLTVTYDLALDDGAGGVSTQPVAFTVMGADDFKQVQLLANNSFDTGNPPGQPTVLPGWTNGNGVSLEVVDKSSYGVGGDGHWLDTQGTPGGILISQTVDVAAGDHATLSFSVAKEFNYDLGWHPNSTLTFTWDGVVVKSITEADLANWNSLQTFSVDVTGQAGGDTLTIHDNGVGQVGYALDWVKLEDWVVA
jgi:VCBS repeat-containing protein